jgi:hypothetical protein
MRIGATMMEELTVDDKGKVVQQSIYYTKDEESKK